MSDIVTDREAEAIAEFLARNAVDRRPAGSAYDPDSPNYSEEARRSLNPKAVWMRGVQRAHAKKRLAREKEVAERIERYRTEGQDDAKAGVGKFQP